MNRKAFTLIELLVVVAIIGILAAVGVVAYNGYTSSAKKAGVKQNHKAVVKWIQADARIGYSITRYKRTGRLIFISKDVIDNLVHVLAASTV